MASRTELHDTLKRFNENDNVYYNPPTNLKMNYRAIRYNLSSIHGEHANDKRYLNRKRYDLIVICKESDPEVVDKLLELPYCSFNTHYKSDNLNHYSLTLYW